MDKFPDEFERRLQDPNLGEDELHELIEEEEHRPLTQKDINEENYYLLKQYNNFRTAAEYVSAAWEAFPEVERIVLFGSVARPLVKEIPRFRKFRRERIAVWHECADVDLAVWINDTSCLSELRKTLGRALNRLLQEGSIGVAHHQVDVIILEPGSDRFLGHLCHFKTCPKDKWDCKVPGCGEIPFLRKYEDFTLYPDALSPERTVELFRRKR